MPKEEKRKKKGNETEKRRRKERKRKKERREKGFVREVGGDVAPATAMRRMEARERDWFLSMGAGGDVTYSIAAPLLVDILTSFITALLIGHLSPAATNRNTAHAND